MYKYFQQDFTDNNNIANYVLNLYTQKYKKGEKMKKRKNIIISAITCMMSICLMMIGVYAASNPSVSISGQVSYSVRDAKVLVIGKVNGQAGDDSNVDYPSIADATNPQEDEKVVKASQYMGFTNGTGVSDNTDNLAPWAMNTTHVFYEDSTGIRPIVISFKMTNLSNYPVVATVDFTGVTDANLASKNLTRTTTGLKDSKVYLNTNVTKEITITYAVANDAVGVNGDGLLNMSIKFEKTIMPPTPVEGQVEITNSDASTYSVNQSDFEYVFDGESFTITRYKKTKTLEGETFEDPTIPSELIIPSKVMCDDGKIYDVKTLGSVTEEQIEAAMNGEMDEELVFGGGVIVDMLKIMSLGDEELGAYMSTLPTSVVISEGIEVINPVSLMYTTGVQELPKSIKSVGHMSCTATSLTTLNLPNLTKIGRLAFEGCALTDISIPSVTSIGVGAFRGCDGLKNENNLKDNAYYIGSSTNPYMLLLSVKDTSITSFQINSNTKQIGENAFKGCTSLTRVDITDMESWLNIDFDVSTINNGEPEAYCNPLYYAHNLYLNGELVTEVTIPNTFTKVKTAVFAGCTSLTNITIPTTVTNIGEGAFYNCSSLTEIVLPNSVTTIDYSAFYGCSSFTTFDIPSQVTIIDVGVFGGCSSLKSITIPSGVTLIGNFAFRDCTSLTSITIPSGVKNIDNGAFYNCSNLLSIAIPSEVKSIGSNAFYGCSSLTRVDITDMNSWLDIDFGITGWTDGFAQCQANPLYYAHNLYLNGELVTEVTIPSTCTKIKDIAFAGCTSLTSVVISDTVTSIGESAFYGCQSLKTVTMLATTPPVLNLNALNISYLEKIYVPASVVDAYKTADGWKDLADKIVGNV